MELRLGAINSTCNMSSRWDLSVLCSGNCFATDIMSLSGQGNKKTSSREMRFFLLPWIFIFYKPKRY